MCLRAVSYTHLDVYKRQVLKLILRGKRIGLSLAECKELIDMYAPSGGNRRQLDHL